MTETTSTVEIVKKRARFRATKENWKPQYTKILYAVQKGKKDTEIAEVISMSAYTVKVVRESPYFKERLASMEAKVHEKVVEKVAQQTVVDRAREKLEKAALKAATRMVKVVQGKETMTTVQLSACKDILDRVGLKPKEVIETHERVYTPEETKSALAVALELESTVQRLSHQNSQFVLPHRTDDRSPDTDESPGKPSTKRPNPLPT